MFTTWSSVFEHHHSQGIWRPREEQQQDTSTFPSQGGISKSQMTGLNFYPHQVVMRSCPLSQPEQCQKRSAKTQDLNTIQSLIIPKMSTFHKKITHYIEKQKNLNISKKTQLTDANSEMMMILELHDKDL